ncbi:ATP-binding protein [Actinacidiphila yanglinensis]|uniref:ATP-binding protein n=1 Tax=Actinacidiphila yanglinensis TaxID=310779 RepID=UPI001F45891E|nr:ATP-binding protein [Actinacidiphila yanglinensis]
MTVAAAVACAAAVRRVSGHQDRLLVAAAGGLAAVLLGTVAALAASRRRALRQVRSEAAELREDTARTLALHAEATRQAAAELDAARRSAREAEVRRRAWAETETSLRAALRAQTARAAELEDEAAQLAEATIPLAVERMREGESTGTVLAELPRPAGQVLRKLLDVTVRELGSSERNRAAGMAACASAAARVQALTTTMLADLRELEQRHDESVLDDLLRLDHCAAQTGRLADSVAVLSGSRSGRRWTRPIAMESVLRGAMGRIHAYRRVRLHTTGGAAVAGHAAEGVMHVLAELMDNACNFSPPSEEVHVYVQESHSGVVVTIEDAGHAMPEADLTRAERLVAGDPSEAAADLLPGLSGTRIGLTVVGRLARKHGLRISFRPSSRGGTGVVVLIPPKLVTRAAVEYAPGSYTTPPAVGGRYAGPADTGAGYDGFPEPARPEEIGHAGPADTGPGHGPGSGVRPRTAGPGTTPGDPASPGAGTPVPVPLPRRTRGRGIPDTLSGYDPSPGAPAREVPPGGADAGDRFGAFRDAATGRDRGSADSEGEGGR